MASDEDLELQAKAMAEKTLPSSLPPAARAAKLPAITQKILERLRKQRDEAEKPKVNTGNGNLEDPAPPAPPPPPVGKPPAPIRIDGVELFGDELWFDDPETRKRLRDSVIEAHREEKILVGPPADEVERICPSNGRILGAGAVLRLGGAHQGGYGEQDIAYAYRQLARALHPDKNPTIPTAGAAFKRLSEAADELRQGLTEQRNALKTLVAFAGRSATAEMLERPQEAIFAEATRVLYTVATTAGEGHIDRLALNRAATFNSQKALLLASEWFQKPGLLDVFGGTPVRTSYDCAPKRYRAQFLCLINRLLLVEARQFGDGHIRAGWNSIMQNFPELALWREFREHLQLHVWDNSNDPKNDTRVYADETDAGKPPEPKEPEMDNQTKAQKLLETYWTLLSGPTFQTAYDKLRHRGKMTLQLGIMQLMEEATQEAVTKLNFKEGKEWKFKQSVELVKEVFAQSEDESIRKKALELERMVEYPPGKLFGIVEERDGRDRDRDKEKLDKSDKAEKKEKDAKDAKDAKDKELKEKASKDKEGNAEEPGNKPTRMRSKWDVGECGTVRVPGRTLDGKPTYRRHWDTTAADAERQCAAWARRWRLAIAALLPSGADGALPLTHPDLRTLAADLWKEILKWTESGAGASHGRSLGLFKADVQTPQTFGWAGRSKAPRGLEPDFPICEWAFVPMSDLLLTVAEGIVGITSEGIFADNFPGHQRFTVEEFYEKIEKLGRLIPSDKAALTLSGVSRLQHRSRAQGVKVLIDADCLLTGSNLLRPWVVEQVEQVEHERCEHHGEDQPEPLPKAPEPPRQSKLPGLARSSAPGSLRGNLQFATRTDQPLATWVDQLKENPVESTVTTVVLNAEFDKTAAWTCQICSQSRIPPGTSTCPTCKRPRGTELRRSYMTASELTQSVVNAVNDVGVFETGGASSTSSGKPKRRGKSPTRAVGKAQKPREQKLHDSLAVTFDDQINEIQFAQTSPASPARNQENAWKRLGVRNGAGEALDKELERKDAPQGWENPRNLRPVRPPHMQAGSGLSRSQGDFREPPPPYQPESPSVGSLPERSLLRGREGMAGPPLPTPKEFQGHSGHSAYSTPSGSRDLEGMFGGDPVSAWKPTSFKTPLSSSQDREKPRTPPDLRHGGGEGPKSWEPKSMSTGMRDREKPRTPPDLRHGGGEGPKSWEPKSMSTGMRDRENPRKPPDLRHGGGLHGGEGPKSWEPKSMSTGVRDREKPRTPPDLRHGGGLHGGEGPKSWEPKSMSTGMRDREKPRTPPDLRHGGGLHGGREDPRSWEQKSMGMTGSSSAPLVKEKSQVPKTVDANMDVETLLQAQKKRIEGLKHKLNTNMA
ncbi:unnamed protein product [Cladocopium goreaui]|uniref:J domain-containing protein n=1 Tax=Cladocopium goreaui TaxID=2562237 RepID=A0A9P1BMB5_9DINO|nr:unnamed protein product [Cladocopium goreaui]